MSTLRLSTPQPPHPTRQAPNQNAKVARDKTPHPDAVVYLIQEPTIPKHNARVIDTSPLLWWGKVRVLMEATQSASFRPTLACMQIYDRLKDFAPDRDYIAVAGGDSLAVILAGAALAQHGHEHFYYLRFERTRLPGGGRDPASGAYVPIYTPLTQQAAHRDMA